MEGTRFIVGNEGSGKFSQCGHSSLVLKNFGTIEETAQDVSGKDTIYQ